MAVTLADAMTMYVWMQTNHNNNMKYIKEGNRP